MGHTQRAVALGKFLRSSEKSRDFAMIIRSRELSQGCRAAGLRRLLGFLWTCRGYAKPGLRGAVERNMRPPGYAVDRVESSGGREISRRLSETVSWPPNGAFAPLTRIPMDISEFGENGPYAGRWGEKRGRPDPRPISYDRQKIVRFPGDSQKLPHGPRSARLRHLL